MVLSFVLISILYPSLTISPKLENKGQVMKTEVKNGHVLFYLENVSLAKIFFFKVFFFPSKDDWMLPFLIDMIGFVKGKH